MHKRNICEANSFNNDGIKRLESGEFHEAIAFIANGLALVRNSILRLDNVLELENFRYLDLNFGHDLESTRYNLVALKLCLKELTPTSDVTTNFYQRSEFTFLKGILIADNWISDHSKVTYDTYIFHIYVMIYNLALAHHMQALFGSNSNEEKAALLMKALSLYEVSLATKQETDTKLSIMLKMAIFNNIGVIYELFDDEDQASIYFQSLLNTILYLNTCPNLDIDASEIECFMKNLIPLLVSTKLSASAAA